MSPVKDKSIIFNENDIYYQKRSLHLIYSILYIKI